MKKNLLIISGTRPNLVKIAPLYNRWKTAYISSFNIKLVHTGQHYDYEMYESFLKDFKLPQPDLCLETKSDFVCKQIAKTLILLEDEMIHNKPDGIIVVGDVNSTLAATLAAVKLHVPVFHLEAGVRSFDISMTEEQNRMIVDSLSSLHFSPTKSSVENLIREGIIEDKIIFVGNILAEILIKFKKEVQRKSNFLLTLHRPFNVDSIENLKYMINYICNNVDGEILFPAHPRTLKNLKLFNNPSNLKIIKPLPYSDFIDHLSRCKCVITDSGGVQTEATILQTPCITLRKNTEWIETITDGTNILVKDIRDLKRAIENSFKKKDKIKLPPFWDGNVSLRIWDSLKKYYNLN